MNAHKLCFLISVVTLISSALCVIVVMYVIIVPHIRLQAHVSSVCWITQFRSASETFAGEGRGIPYTIKQDNSNNGEQCIQASAQFVDRYGEMNMGYLRFRRYDVENTHTVTSKVFLIFAALPL